MIFREYFYKRINKDVEFYVNGGLKMVGRVIKVDDSAVVLMRRTSEKVGYSFEEKMKQTMIPMTAVVSVLMDEEDFYEVNGNV